MTTHAVLIPDSIVATNVDTYTRSAKHATVDLDNGNVVQLVSKSSTAGEGEVWLATAPATSNLNNLWMAFDPESVTTGGKYRNIDPDVRNFFNALGLVFTAYKPQVGDLITLTADALTGTKGSNTFVNASNTSYVLTWGATQTASALSYRLVATNYISIPDGVLGSTGRVVSYQFECVGN